MSSSGKIVCESCGRQYGWKPELAGRTVKCKCGAAITVPRESPVAAVAAPDGYDLADGAADSAPTYAPAAYTPPAYSAPAGSRETAAAGTATAAGRTPKARRGGTMDSAKKSELKKIAVIAVGLVLVIGLIIGAKLAFDAFGSSKPKNLKGMDGVVASMTDENAAYEVLGWLKENNRRGVVGFFWTREKTELVAQEWYDHGAKKVLAFGGVMTRCLAIELPDDKAKREYFFEYAQKFSVETHPGKVLQKDEGQKYVVINFLGEL